MLIRILVCVCMCVCFVKATVGFDVNAVWSQKISSRTPSFDFHFWKHTESWLLLTSYEFAIKCYEND